MDFIPLGNYPWVPILLFLVIIFANGIIGFFLGWKTMLYFFTGNLLFIIIGVFIYIPIYNLITQKIMGEFTIADNDISGLLAEARAYWGAIFLVGWLSLINIILGIVYIFIRKYLKVKKVEGLSTLKKVNRKLAGVSLGTLSGLLFAIPVMSTSTMLFSPLNIDGKESKLDRFSNWTLKAVSFGQMYDSQNAQRMSKLLKLITNKQSSLFVLADLLSDSSVLDKDVNKSIDVWNNGSEDLKIVFGDPDLTAQMLKSVPTFNEKKTIKSGKEYSVFVNKFLKGTVSKFQPLNLDQDTQKVFKGLFSNVFEVEDAKGKKLEKESDVVSNYFASHLFGDGSYQLPPTPKF